MVLGEGRIVQGRPGFVNIGILGLIERRVLMNHAERGEVAPVAT